MARNGILFTALVDWYTNTVFQGPSSEDDPGIHIGVMASGTGLHGPNAADTDPLASETGRDRVRLDV
jgi:hypothetical protein